MIEPQKIPWKRTTVEVSAIVASILLAFAIDAWWEERTERARADELLLSLELEWSTEVNRIDERLNQYDRSMTAMIRFLDAHSTGASNLSPSDAVEIIRNIRRWSTFKPSVAAYEVLLAYGLDRIEDRDLRLAVASWPSALAEVTPEQEALHRVALLDAREQRSRLADDFERPWHDTQDDDSYNWFGIAPGDMAISQIRDHEAARVQMHILNLMYQYRNQLVAVRETLSQNLEILQARNSRLH